MDTKTRPELKGRKLQAAVRAVKTLRGLYETECATFVDLTGVRQWACGAPTVFLNQGYQQTAIPLNSSTLIMPQTGSAGYGLHWCVATFVQGVWFYCTATPETVVVYRAELRDRCPDAPGCQVDLTPAAEAAAAEGV